MKGIQIGIIGGTRGMGRWFADYLTKQGFSVHVSGRTTGMPAAKMARLCQVVVVSVPISATDAVIANVGPLLKKESLLMDLTSVKRSSVKAMLEFSPSEVIGCHPLFGPQVTSAAGQHVVLCPARTEKWLPWLRDILEKGGASLVETTPERHDEIMAVIQGLNHLNTIMMGLALGKTSAPLSQLDPFTTPLFSIKSKIVQRILNNNPRLYAEILCGNRKFTEIIDLYGEVLASIRSFVEKRDVEGLTAAMEETASRLWPAEQ